MAFLMDQKYFPAIQIVDGAVFFEKNSRHPVNI